MKKAFLVEFNVRTRVVVDLPENYMPGNNSFAENLICETAINKILADPSGYICWDNIIGADEDEEVPYDKEFDG